MSGRWKRYNFESDSSRVQVLWLRVVGAGVCSIFSIGLALALPTFLIGTIKVAIISSFHSGVWGMLQEKDAFTDKDIKRLAELGVTQKESTSSEPKNVASQLEKLAKFEGTGNPDRRRISGTKEKGLRRLGE